MRCYALFISHMTVWKGDVRWKAIYLKCGILFVSHIPSRDLPKCAFCLTSDISIARRTAARGKRTIWGWTLSSLCPWPLLIVIACVQAVKWRLNRRSRELIVTDAERKYVQPSVVGRVFETLRFRCWLCYSVLENGFYCVCIYFLLFARLVLRLILSLYVVRYTSGSHLVTGLQPTPETCISHVS